MSDVDDVARLGRRALRSSRVEPLRRRMRAFLDEHDREVDIQELRRETSAGISMAEVVDEGRTERL